jgi:hypothetical protein
VRRVLVVLAACGSTQKPAASSTDDCAEWYTPSGEAAPASCAKLQYPLAAPIVVGPGRIRVGLRAPVAEMPSTGGSIVIVDPDWKLHVARTPAVAAARH